MKKIQYGVLTLIAGLIIQGCATTNSNVSCNTGPGAPCKVAGTPAAGARCMTATTATACTSDEDISDVIADSSAPESLEKITVDTDIPMVMNEKVQYFITYFSTTQHDVFAKWLERSERYVPKMKKIMKENGLPEDLVYMAMIESGFNTHAFSRSRACGPWQFMRSTARLYDLKVNWWVDERRNPEKSTLAAARYLKSLYDTFGSWYLAEAAYNAGPLMVEWAMREQNTDNFWSLAKERYLRKETRDYVPEIIAAAMIAKDPAAYGFTDLTYEKPVEVERMVLHRQIDLRVIARADGTTVDAIKRLNPELLRGATPPVPSYTLDVPSGTMSACIANLEKIPEHELYTPERIARVYIIRKGDTLSRIAMIHHVSVHDLRIANHIENVRDIRPGRRIIVPGGYYGRREVAAYSRRAGTIDVAYKYAANARYIYYRVKSGDTLWDIAHKFDVSVSRLKYNNKIRGGLIKPNMILKIPKVIAREG